MELINVFVFILWAVSMFSITFGQPMDHFKHTWSYNGKKILNMKNVILVLLGLWQLKPVNSSQWTSSEMYRNQLPVVTPRVIYGHRADVQNSAHYITDDDVMYASGAVIILQNIETSKQKYLVLPEKVRHLIRLAISPHRNFIATLFTTGEEYLIHIYDSFTLKKKRTASLPPESISRKIESFAFSYDERFVMMISGPPDWMMLGFNWERGKIESSTKATMPGNPPLPVKEVVCSPVDSGIVVIYGHGVFRLMNLQETVWRQYGFQKAENYDITTCCFLGGDRVVCGTADGLLLLVELAELRVIFEAEAVNYINARPDKEEEIVGSVPSSMVVERAKAIEESGSNQERAVRALTPLTKGFAYACGSIVHFFEKLDAHRYKKRNLYEIAEKDFRENQTMSLSTILHLAVNNSQTKLLATTRRCQLYEVKLWGPDIDIAGKIPFKHLWFSYHSGNIVDLAICYWKPIFITCGEIDRTVRVWNYLTSTLEMVKQYQEDIHSASLHPTGLYAAVGFSDKLRFMVVLIDDLQVSRELPIRECPKSAFNTSGHLLAAVNRNVIQVYNTITFQNVGNLKGHSGSITCLQWTQDDKKLISCGTDGAIYEWDMNTFRRTGEIVHKGLSYWECAVTSDGTTVYSVGTDHLLKEFRGFNTMRGIKVAMTHMVHVLVSHADQTIFIGGMDGWLMCVKMPVDEPPEYELLHIHAWKIQQMKLTVDDRTLITCSSSGTICVWNLDYVDDRFRDKDFKYFNEILISKADLEEKVANIRDLTQRTYELEMEHAYQLRHTQAVYKDKIKDIQGIYNQALDELKETLDVLEANHNIELNNITSDINVIKERHEAEMLEMEAKYNAELIIEYDKISALEKQTQEVMKDFEAKLETFQITKERTIEELTRINESKLYNLNKMVDEAREEINKEAAEHTELTTQIEDDKDREIEESKSKYDKQLKGARESNIRLKGESGVLKKKVISCEKERDLIQMEILSVSADLDKLKRTIKNAGKEIQELKKEISERDIRIQEKEKKIYDLNTKLQEYERFKFVLNYRIKELRSQIEPRDKQIKEKKEQIAEMEVELYELHKINLNLDNALSTMREKLGGVYKDLDVFKGKNNSIFGLIKKVKAEIYTASAHTHDYKKLKEIIKKLYVKYITDKDFAKTRKGDLECIAELQRQKVYLEGIVGSLTRYIEVGKNVKYGEGMIYMEMNWALMEEINKIRKKLKTAQSKIQDMETLIYVKLAKIYSPRQSRKVLQTALTSMEEIKEECEIRMEEATSRAAMMREETDALYRKIVELENSIKQEVAQRKPFKEGLHFNIPSIN